MRAPDTPTPELVKIEADRLKAEMPEVVERLLRANVWNMLADIDPHRAARLFQRACFSVLRGTVTHAELRAEAKRIQATVKHVRQVAVGLDHQDRRRQLLGDAATALNEISIEMQFYDGPLIVERKRADPIARAYATILSHHMVDVFGEPHDKVVAAIATAALGKAVSPRNVASWREQDRNRSS
jgi:hypothetical protein